MGGLKTRGHDRAVAAIGVLIERPPHALLIAGPESVGKTTLARDLAAILVCTAPAVRRPCGECRGCRLVASGNHPDVHAVAPAGAGDQIRVEAVRELVVALALLPLEGGARVAVIERAHRMNEDAQNALLKTLEEPPAGVTIVLCTNEEDRLLPTVRSRCARLRLGPVGTRTIEELLGSLGLADPGVAARLARLAGGRPGAAIALARAPELVAARAEVALALLDLLGARRARRLAEIRSLLARALEVGPGGEPSVPTGEPGPDAAAGRLPAAERRRAAAWLIDVWSDVARDLAVAALGGRRELRDPALLEDLEVAAGRLGPGEAAAFLARLAEASAHLDANVSPELELDALVLAWPHAA